MVSAAQEEALAMLSPLPGNPPGVPNIPSPPQGPQVIRLPHPPSTAHSGGHSAGYDSSANIVADGDIYNSFAHGISRLDDAVNYAIHHTASEIANICQTVFIMPSVTSAVVQLTNEIQSAMVNARNGAHDLIAAARNFSNEITNIE